MIDKPYLLEGGVHVDDRGFLKHINAFDTSVFKRFYIVGPHTTGYVRAFHGHMHESKAAICLSGVAKIVLIRLEDETKYTFILDSNYPKALMIPAGFANGFQSLSANCQIMFFSSVSMDEAKNDDLRYDWNKWDNWENDYR